jgi:hypothetical protein
MRGLSLFILKNAANPDKDIWGLNNYNLSTAVAPAPVPANFHHLKRISSQQGSAPMGGFHIATAPVTQREYESIMKQNPSMAKNPDNPVTNVSIIDAMMYCNQISIRDGLEPAYIIEYTGAHKDWLWGIQEEVIDRVTFDRYASGYRLPTTDEWSYASNNSIEGMGVPPEYVFDGAFEGRVEGIRLEDRRRATYMGLDSDSVVSGKIPLLVGSIEDTRVTPVIRPIRPVFDYWKYTSGE